MIARAKRGWRLLKNGKPGDRFQVRYYYRKQRSPGRLSRIFNIVFASALVIVSTFFGWAPGPGMVTLVIGLALVGGVWRSSAIGKALIVLVVLILVAAFGYVIYSVFFGGL